MLEKQVELISHASVLISIGGLKILTDPWFVGTAFNEGWSLDPSPNFDTIKDKLADVDIVWISHEHPDHLHFPTLKLIREFLPQRVRIAFQETNSDKVFDALRKLGYNDFIRLEHMKKLELNEIVSIAVCLLLKAMAL